MIAKPMMIQSQGVPPSVVAGAAGEPDVAGGVAWASAAFTAARVVIVKTLSLSSIMFPFRPQGLRINVGHTPAFLSFQGLAHPFERVRLERLREFVRREPPSQMVAQPPYAGNRRDGCPLALAYQRATMGDPTYPSSVPPHDDEHVPVLDDAPRSGAHTTSEEVVPLVEEIATIAKRQVVTGRVRVQTLADTVEELAHAEVQRETVEVTRVPIDKVVETPPEIRTDGDVTIVPVLEEVLVVEKRLVLKEELHIRRRVETETVEVPVTLRKQRAIIERTDPDDPVPEDPAT
jgi:stress response protein YsnF